MTKWLPSGKLHQTPNVWLCRACKTILFARLENFESSHRPAICMWRGVTMGANHVSRRTSQICKIYLIFVRTAMRKIKWCKWMQQKVVGDGDHAKNCWGRAATLCHYGSGTTKSTPSSFEAFQFRRTAVQNFVTGWYVIHTGSWRRDNASGNACTEFDNPDCSVCRSQWPRDLRRESTVDQLLGLLGRMAPGQGCLSLVSVVCCQVQVPATGRSHVRRSPTECPMSKYDLETSTMRKPLPIRAVEP